MTQAEAENTLDPAPALESSRSSGSDEAGRGRSLREALRPLALLSVPVLLVLLAGWQKRMTLDDGFINMRVVDQVFAGSGPVFNFGERVEAYTSPVWLAVLIVLRALFGWAADITELAAVAGVLMAAAAIALAEDGAVHLVRSIRLCLTDTADPVPSDLAQPRLYLPVGALALAAFAPMWHYATTGLDSALFLFWIAASFSILARRGHALLNAGRPRTKPYRSWTIVSAVFVGSGWLVRPDAALFSIAFLVVLLLLTPANFKASLRVVGLALAPSLAYQIFRMGYFGSLLPNTALAKEASQSNVSLGWRYVNDTVTEYSLWPVVIVLMLAAACQLLPLLIIHRWSVGAGGRSPQPPTATTGSVPRWRIAMIALAPALAGILHFLWVIRVGGDYLHARFLLPSLFAVALPAAAVPVPLQLTRKSTSTRVGHRLTVARGLATITPLVAFSVIGVWSFAEITAHGAWRPDTIDQLPTYFFLASDTNPLKVSQFPELARVGGSLRAMAAKDELYFVDATKPGSPWLPLKPGQLTTAYMASIGASATAAGPDVWVVDQRGLSDPIGSRLTTTFFLPGHQKDLPIAVAQARFVEPQALSTPAVDSARRALKCGELAELMAATTDPITPARFVQNLIAAPRLTVMRIPNKPADMEAQFCAPPS